MSSHTVRIENYLKANVKTTSDSLSKMFIGIQLVFGMNRIRLITKKYIPNILSTIYVLCVFSYITSGIIQAKSIDSFFYRMIWKYIQETTCVILCYTSHNNILQFYKQLNKFDDQTKFKYKVNCISITIFFCMLLACTLGLWNIYFLSKDNTRILFAASLLLLHLVQNVEYYYYAFLFNILNQRIQFINKCIATSMFSSSSLIMNRKVDYIYLNNYRGETEIVLNKFLDIYYIVIDAYNFLTDGIKWQLLIIITTSFIHTLLISYDFALTMLSGNYGGVYTLVQILVVGSEPFCMVGLSMCCDMVCLEVRRLRELLASKLFQNKLDKPNRRAARALLALTKSRNLSFSLLRMVDISISLPFAFLGLIATYLIILLQFQKVINPGDHPFYLLNNSSIDL